MGLDVWFREDVARVLQAARVAGREAQAATKRAEGLGDEPIEGAAQGVRPVVRVWESQEMVDYWRGYEAALSTIGAAFGLTWGPQQGEAEPQAPALPDAGWASPNGRPRLLDTTGAWE